MEFGEDRETAMAAMIPFAFKETPLKGGDGTMWMKMVNGTPKTRALKHP